MVRTRPRRAAPEEHVGAEPGQSLHAEGKSIESFLEPVFLALGQNAVDELLRFRRGHQVQLQRDHLPSMRICGGEFVVTCRSLPPDPRGLQDWCMVTAIDVSSASRSGLGKTVSRTTSSTLARRPQLLQAGEPQRDHPSSIPCDGAPSPTLRRISSRSSSVIS
jgi:hypothetical protein